MNRLSLISELISEVRELENTVLFAQNRILAKRITIEEIFQGADAEVKAAQHELEKKEQAGEAIVATEAETEELSIPQLIIRELPLMNGSVFWYPDLKKKILAKHPTARARLQKGIYVACTELVNRGFLVRAPGGFRAAEQNNHAAAPST